MVSLNSKCNVNLTYEKLRVTKTEICQQDKAAFDYAAVQSGVYFRTKNTTF